VPVATWDAVLDVSNICCSELLPPVRSRMASWNRLILVMEAWRRRYDENARLYLVADEALAFKLDDAERRLFNRWRSDGTMFADPTADPRILDLARGHGLHVISEDRFIDFRTRHPWIEREPHRFHHWTTTSGRVRFVPAKIFEESPQRKSKEDEKKGLRHEYRLDPKNPAHRELMATRWRCTGHDCWYAKMWPDQLWAWPVPTPDGGARCPRCHEDLDDLGPRKPVVGIVIEDTDQNLIISLPLEEGAPLVLGREGDGDLFDLAMFVDHTQRDAVRSISHEHLELRLNAAGGGYRVLARDLGSKNGTEILRRAGRGFDAPRRLVPDQETSVNGEDLLLLSGRIRVRRSGRIYHPEKRRPDSRPRLPGTGGATALPEE
jgi:hypothetical protein